MSDYQIAILEKLDPVQLQKLSLEQLKGVAVQAVQTIVDKINLATEKVEQSRSSADRAAELKVNVFGFGQSKKTDAIADATVKTNEALAETQNLMRVLIGYTMLNARLSKYMHGYMAKVVKDGFKDRDGELVRVNETGTEMFNMIMDEADEFSRRQLQIEAFQSKQEELIRSVDAKSQQQAKQLSAHIAALKEKAERHDLEIRTEIAQRASHLLNRSDENDERHDLMIEDLQKKSAEIQRASDDQDEIHTKQIMELLARVESLEATNKTSSPINLVLWISITALIISTTAIALVLF
jgi:hypothetical protein